MWVCFWDLCHGDWEGGSRLQPPCLTQGLGESLPLSTLGCSFPVGARREQDSLLADCAIFTVYVAGTADHQPGPEG